MDATATLVRMAGGGRTMNQAIAMPIRDCCISLVVSLVVVVFVVPPDNEDALVPSVGPSRPCEADT